MSQPRIILLVEDNPDDQILTARDPEEQDRERPGYRG